MIKQRGYQLRIYIMKRRFTAYLAFVMTFVSLLVYAVPLAAFGITTNVLEFQLIIKKVKYYIILHYIFYSFKLYKYIKGDTNWSCPKAKLESKEKLTCRMTY